MRRDLIPYRRVAKLDTLEDVRRFHDRADAGRQLAQRLDAFRGQDVVVLGLPRGGVPVAFEVAKALRVPLDVVVVRKLGVPFQPELAFGAIGEGGVRVTNDSVVRHAGLSRDDMDAVEDKQRAELQRRSEHFCASTRGAGAAPRSSATRTLASRIVFHRKGARRASICSLLVDVGRYRRRRWRSGPTCARTGIG